MNLWQTFELGGFLMWPLAGCLATALAIGLERALYFGATYFPYADFERWLLDSERAGEPRSLSPARQAWDRLLPAREFRFKHSVCARLSFAYFRMRSASAERREAAMQRIGETLLEEMERRVGVLALIASAAPLIGLLGTVLGMMQSFQTIAGTGGQADISQLAGGIWVAMITTAAGLLIAIPAQFLHATFSGAVHRRVRRLNRIMQHFEERFHERRESQAAPGAETIHAH